MPEEAEQEDHQTLDRHLIAAATLTAVASLAWVSALTIVLVRATEGTPDTAVINGVLSIAVASTVLAGMIGTDVARRRRMKDQVKAVSGACSIQINAAHAETVEALGALAKEIEQVGVSALGRSREFVAHVGELASTQAILAGEMAEIRRLLEAIRTEPDPETPVEAGGDDPAARAAAVEVFEMGRRVGKRQAVREMAQTGAPLGS